MPQTRAKSSPKSAYINARITPALKRDAERVLEALGVSTTEAITMFMRQVVLQRGLPFSLRIPNAETAAAIAESREHPETVKTYDGVDSMMNDLWPE